MRPKHLVVLALAVLFIFPSCGKKHRGGPELGSGGIQASITSPTVGQTDVLSIAITNATTTTYTIAWTSEPPATFSGQVDTPTSSTVNFSASTAGSYVVTVSVTDTGGRASLAQITIVVTPVTAQQTTNLEAKRLTTPPDASYWTNADYIQFTADGAHGSTGESYAGEYNQTGSKAGISATVRMKAAYTNTDLYVWASWQDPTGTNDLNRRRWFFNGGTSAAVPSFPTTVTQYPNLTEQVPPGWSSNLNDDKIGIMWDVDGASTGGSTFAANGCAMTCHTPNDMYPDTGTTDLWHYKTSRSNPLGLVNDQYCTAANSGRKTDPTLGLETRNGTLATGPAWVWDPSKSQNGFAMWDGTTKDFDPVLFLLDVDKMPIEGDAVAGNTIFTASCQGCHGADGKGVTGVDFGADSGLKDPATLIDTEASAGTHPGQGAWNALSATDKNNVISRIRAFAGVPGYTLKMPSDLADSVYVLNYPSVYNGGTYTVIFRRKLTTTLTTKQTQFTDTSATASYPFSVAIMDFDGKNHAGGTLQHLVFKSS